MTYRRTSRYRRRRRFNPGKAFLSLLLVVIIGASLYLVSRALFGEGGLLGRGPASSAASGATQETPPPEGSLAATPTDELPTPEPVPTPRPTPEPMEPESSDPDIIRMSWRDPAVFDGPNAFGDAVHVLDTVAGRLQSWILSNNEPSENPGESIEFGDLSSYQSIEGVLTFRGNHYRDGGAAGTRSITEEKLEIVWSVPTGSISAIGSYWPGTGWTGQPLLVKWSEETRNAMNLLPEAKLKDLTEVIYPTLDGNIYFLDLETGVPTRDAIEVGFPFKGTAAVDPRGYPLLYAGQGLNENGNKVGDFKFHFFNLLDQTEIYGILGRDPMAFRPWGAFDSSPLIHAESDTLLQGGENGLLYKVKLNTEYNAEAGTLQLAPQLTKFRYHLEGNPELGIESSVAAYRNYLYFADNGGVLVCLDMNTMTPVWAVDTGDDTDCTTVIEETDEGVFLYTANEVDKRLEGGQAAVGDCNIRKFDALTGRLIWQVDIPCVYQFYLNGGALATPMLGKDDISDLIIFNIAFTGTNQSGTLLALDKRTGETIWTRHLPAYSWSSPVAIRSQEGKTYGVFGDFSGLLHLFDPRTGKDLDTVSLGGNIESTPAVFDDMIVLGSYAKKLFGIRIR